ncbi:8414_t:CDS:10 [Ambispora leptoticha]|uniref:8414_t:CDS:1 n=1 Tax=Ambispora leptoticha TaxID=144679 RepID=A0A9N8V806_9GLOM|nr:8414_t:CDS:10 [Ambispora leptoticha]
MKAGISKEELKEEYAKHKVKTNVELFNKMIEEVKQGKKIEVIEEEDIKKSESISCCELRQLFREVLNVGSSLFPEKEKGDIFSAVVLTTLSGLNLRKKLCDNCSKFLTLLNERIAQGDTERRIEELLKILKGTGADLIEVDGKPLSQVAKELEQKINDLKKENAGLKEELEKSLTIEKLKEIFDEKNFEIVNGKVKYKGVASTSDQQTAKPNGTVDPSKPAGKPAWTTGSDEDAETIYNNGWRNIATGYTSNGQTTNNIDQKTHLKNEVDKAHNLLNRIKNETDLTKLPSDSDVTTTYNENKVPSSNVGLDPTQSRTAYDNGDEVDVLKNKTADAQINALDDNKLPASKSKEQILKILQDHRNTFKYKLDVEDNEVKGDEYKPLTASILNELLEDFLDKSAQKEDLDGREIKIAEVKEVNGKEQFTGQRIKTEIDGKTVIEKEEKWSKVERLDLTGTYLLPFVYSLINFDPDQATYATLDKNGEIDKSGSGVLPILTGGGKTTKTMGCLVRGGEKTKNETDLVKKGSNVVLICPNEALAADAEAEKLLGYIARSTVIPDNLKEPNSSTKYVKDAEMKKKVIAKDETIIVFDEAHFNDAKYQELQKRLVKEDYKVIIMSATFPKKKFSITMSHPREVLLVPQFEPEYLKDKDGSILTMKDSEVDPKTGNIVTVLDPATGKKDKKVQLLYNGLTAKQKKLLDDNDIAYVSFDRTNQGAVTGITQGMPNGSIFFANPNHEMGFSPHIHNVICTGRSQLISLASMVQQIGRVARLFPGSAYLLTKDLYDVDAETGKVKVLKPAKDLAYKFVTAALSGAKADLDYLGTQGANMSSDPNFLRAALGLGYKFGLKPEEILVGTGGIKPFYPVFGVKPTPPVVDEEVVPKQGGKKGETEKVIDEEAVKEVIKVLNAFVDKRRKELKNYKEDKNEYSTSEKDTFDELVGLYRTVNGTEVKVGMVENKRGELKPTISITYPAPISGRRALVLEEEIGVWRCHRCLKVNNGYRFCEQCGIDFRIDKEEGSRFLEQDEILMAQVLQRED